MQFYLEGLDAQQASPPWCRPYNFPTQCMPRLVHLDQFNSIHWLERLHYSGIIVCMQSTQKELTFSSDVGCTKLSFPNWAAKQRYWDLDLKLLACTRIELSRRETFQRNHISTKTNFRLVVPTKFMHLEDLPCLGKQAKRFIVKEASKAKSILQSVIWSKERSCNTRFVLVAQNLFDHDTIDAPPHIEFLACPYQSLAFIIHLNARSAFIDGDKLLNSSAVTLK